MTTAQPLVSIILPVHNGARYLDESVRSCLDQSYSNFELIVVDDASTDSTPQLIERWTKLDRRVKAIRHETNRKLPAALNTGFSVATGAYLTWTSDDNAYRPNAIAEMVAFLEKNHDVGVVYADYTLIDEDGRTVKQVSAKTPEAVPLYNWVGCCFLYRRDVQEKLCAYDESLFLAEDYDFWLRAVVNFKLSPLHKDLYLYRRHDRTLTSLQSDAVIRAAERAIQRNFKTMTWLTRKQRATFNFSSASDARYRNDFQMARLSLCKAFYYSPMVVCAPSNIRLICSILLGRKFTETLKALLKNIHHI